MALPLALFVRGFASLRHRKLNLTTTRAHEIGASLFIMYCGGIASVTVLGTPAASEQLTETVNLIPFRFAYDMFYGCFAGKPAAAWINILGNIALFVPFGFLLSLLWRGASWQKAVLLSAGFSAAVELCQLTQPARMTDVDDVLLNSLGGFVGYLLFRLIKAGTAETFRVTEIKTYTSEQE